MMSEMDGLIPAVANLSVQSSLRRKPVRPASSIPPPPTFCAELEGSMPTIPRPQASGDFDQGLIPLEREPPPDHKGLIPLHAPHSATVSHAGPPSTAVSAGLPLPSQTPGTPDVVYRPAAYPSWPQSYASHHPQPAPLVSPTHSLPTPSVSSTTSPPPIPGIHSSGQKLGDFASSVFSKETVKWSKKTASRFGGALKSAATSAHEAATKAQVAAVRATEQRRQRQAGIVVPQQTTNPQLLYTPQYWASSHLHAQNTASHQQSAIPFVPPARQDQSQSQSPAALAPVSQGQTPHVFASNQTPSSPPPPLAKFHYPQISASPLSLPSHPQPHYSLPGHHLQHHQQHQQHQQQHYLHHPQPTPTVALVERSGGGGSFLPPPAPTGPSAGSWQQITTADPTTLNKGINAPGSGGGNSSTLKTVGTGKVALAAVGGLTRLLIAASTGEDVGEMDFGSGGGEEAVVSPDSGESCEAPGEQGDGAGYPDTYGEASHTLTSSYADHQEALQANHFANMINAQANVNALTYVSNTTTTYGMSSSSNLVSDPYRYSHYIYTPDPASCI
ncbi:hypothetical protein QC761_001230 [Podospora bellae-mahoneyi]|uniref:Uncharacterized protein n=1 Tax=Podospora bellae-mahoneyi TaxID=2093777 RepID=A0ABR0FR30_9PEZI|nr:hypothetical protein QC761_001230 [Podospora bellae-mahoneyi]